MLRNVLSKTLRDSQRAFVWWCVGLIGLVALMVSVYPSVRGNEALNKLVHDYPQALKGFVSFGGELDYTTGPGYLGSELFALMVPLLLLVAAIGAGARALAGEEEAGTLELLLANPVSRRRVAAEKLAALVVEIVALGIVLLVSLWIGCRAADLRVSATHLAAATLSAVVLATGFGALALLVGAVTGRRARASGLTAALAVAAYVVQRPCPARLCARPPAEALALLPLRRRRSLASRPRSRKRRRARGDRRGHIGACTVRIRSTRARRLAVR